MASRKATLCFIVFMSSSLLFANAQDASSDVSGKAIYTSSRNPIASYFKEQKSKLRPYFTRPTASETGSNPYAAPFGDDLRVHDETGASLHSSNSYSNYYDSTATHDNNLYQPPGSPVNSKGDHHEPSTYMDPYDPSNFYEASNAVYSVADPSSGYPSAMPQTGNGANPGYFGGDPLHGSYPPSYHPPGMPASSSANPGYYGSSEVAYAPQQPAVHDNSLYSSSPAAPAAPQPASAPEVAPAPTYHHNYENKDEQDNADLLFPIVGYPDDTDEEAQDHGAGYENDYVAPEDDDMLLEIPKKPLKPMVEGLVGGLMGGGGGGSGGDAGAATPPPAATDAAAAAENPLNFLNLVGTDFQPGRLVNIFFGLFIMLFMIISHGYALWILGIAYLPGTRSLNNWEVDKEKIGEICDSVLDALEYWENRID